METLQSMYFLVMMLCTGVNNTCVPDTFVAPTEYTSHYECVMDGYSTASMTLASMNPIMVESNRMFITFSCHTAKEMGISGT